MGGLKEDIKDNIFLKHYGNIMEDMQFDHHIQAKNKDTHKSTMRTYTRSIHRFGVHKTTVPQPTRFRPQQMDEIRENRNMFQL